MDLTNLSIQQKDIIEKLELMFENKEQLNNWLSLPNKMFRGRLPIDVLLSGNYDYFERFFDNNIGKTKSVSS